MDNWIDSDKVISVGRLYSINKQICDNTPLKREGNQIFGRMERNDELLYEVLFPIDSPPESGGTVSIRGKLVDLLGGDIRPSSVLPHDEVLLEQIE